MEKTPDDSARDIGIEPTQLTPDHELARDVTTTRVDTSAETSSEWVRQRLAPHEFETFRIGRFSVLEQLGEGGMGVVFAAYDGQLDRKVAVKLVLAATEGDPRYQRRLLEEARSMAQLEHPNVASVYEVGEHTGGVFVAMEFIRGQTLRAWIETKPSLEEMLQVFVQAGEGLAAAHAAGLVHRDFKPDNVMLGDDGRVRVLDFGLAMPQVDHAPAESRTLLRSTEIHDSGPAKTVGVAGTPAYMAPEVYAGEVSNPASDQFSYCVALWEALYGQRPFQGASLTKLVSAASAGEVREVSAHGRGGIKIPVWLREALNRGIAAKPADRWSSMRELLDALEAGDPRAAARRRWFGAGTLALIAAAVGGLKLHEDQLQRERISACEEHAASLKWDETSASQLHDAITQTEAEDAVAIADKAIAGLNAFGQAWKELRTETCLRQTVRGDIDPELAERAIDCLARERITLEATLETLMPVEKGMVTRVDATLGPFADVSHCADEDHLRRIPALPTDPKTREAIRELEFDLARTLVHEHFGTYQEGLDESRAALERAEPLAYLPTIAKARYREAVFLEKLGKYEDSANAWALSFREALLSDHETLAGDAAMALAFTEGYQLARHDTGVRWAELAGVYLERTGQHEGLSEGKRLDVLAVLLEMRGDLEASAETHERSLAIRRSKVGPRHHDIAYGLVNYSFVADKLGNQARALSMLKEALSIFEEHYGPDNPTTNRVVQALAGMEQRMGHLDEAEAAYERVRKSWARSLGEEHPDYGDLLRSLADLRVQQGRPTEAEAYLRDALRIHRAALEPDHPDVTRSMLELAQLLTSLEQAKEARALLEEVVQSDGTPAGPRGKAEFGLGELDLSAGRVIAARGHFEAARRAFASDDEASKDWLAQVNAALQKLDAAPGPAPTAN